jgi:hypothetical protein
VKKLQTARIRLRKSLITNGEHFVLQSGGVVPFREDFYHGWQV